ncbi:MAG: Na+/H+ antiporter NhaC family protein [Spirochaetaceae bacterium]|jgi:Na+/H+ antiporter NhaC|nr:Na+/H+ antiporter NhaC family protein [Spirochaetaceae bacterium]
MEPITDPVNAQLWAFVPVIIAIGTIFLLRNVIASLFIGIAAGAAIWALMLKAGVLDFLHLLFSTIFNSAVENIALIGFIYMLGALVYIISRSGGHHAYGRWIARKIKTSRGVSLATMALGVLIFIDDYFSCLVVGSVMDRPVDDYKISREKLAYFIDTTAGPVCILAPLSSWSPTITQTVESAGIDKGLFVFIKSIPYNYYGIFALVLGFYIAFTGKDFFAMRRRQAGMQKGRPPVSVEGKSKGKIIDLVLPNVMVVLFTLMAIAWLGGYFGPEKVSIIDAYAAADTTMAISFACLAAIVLCFILYIPRRLLSVHQFFTGVLDGMKSMFEVNLILILAWSLSVITTEFLGAGNFVESLMRFHRDSVNVSFLPVAIFAISALIAPGLGSWGTFLMIIPFVAIIARATDPSMFPVFLGAILAGSVFGDHASPITDTTVLSSASARCDHISHVKTQLPYALVICFSSIVSFVCAGIFRQSLPGYAAGIIVAGALLFGAYQWEKRRGHSNS